MHLRRATENRFGRLAVVLLSVLTLSLGLMLSLGITFALAGCAPVAGVVPPAPTSGSASGPASASASPPASSPTTAPTPLPPPAMPAAMPAASVPVVDASLGAQAQPASPPIRIQVDALGIDMPVESSGLDQAGAMALPPNTDVAAWYRFGPAPAGAAGATVIAAHVDSLKYGIGPFSRFAAAPAGTEIVITTADGTQHRYAIDGVNLTTKSDVPWAAIFDRSGPPRLTIVTCGGEFDYVNRHYLSNVVVTAAAR